MSLLSERQKEKEQNQECAYTNPFFELLSIGNGSLMELKHVNKNIYMPKVNKKMFCDVVFVCCQRDL